MNLIVVVLYLLTTLNWSQSRTQLQVIFVIPVGEELTTEEREVSLQSIRGARSFWERHIPEALDLEIIERANITETDRIYTDFSWSPPHHGNGIPTLFIIDNSSSRRLFILSSGIRAIGVTRTDWNVSYVLITGAVGTNGLAAVIAHEFGHLFFDLPDIALLARDIMSVPTWAYNDDVIGCQTSMSLNRPCDYVTYLPHLQ